MQTASAVARASVRTRLLADHQRLETLLDDMLVAPLQDDAAVVDARWTEFVTSLLAHLEDEEANFIPALLRARPRDAYVLLQEHRHIRARATEIATAVSAGTPTVLGIRNFRDELRAHAQTENRLLYEWLDEPSNP